jgi:hypothetical protein
MGAAKTTRKQLTPFGGINGRANYEKMKRDALLTKSRQECFDMGFLTVQDLDDEELRYGRCRDDRGRIPKDSKKTELIPKEQYEAMVQEHELRYKQKLRQRLDSMIDIMTDIAEDETVEPRDRFEAAKYIFERTAGKTPDTVNVNIKSAPWEDLLGEITGIASIKREQHREVGAGIIDVEAEELPNDDTAEEDQHSQSADDSSGGYAQEFAPEVVPEVPETTDAVPVQGPNGYSAGEPGQRQDVGDRDTPVQGPSDLVTTHDNHDIYGRRADENRSYAEQARAADRLAKARKERREKVQQAKKQRKIARAMGADAIKDEITGVDVGDDGQVTFGSTDQEGLQS